MADRQTENKPEDTSYIGEKEVHGYKLEHLLSAAVKPPMVVTPEDQEMTHNPKVKFLVGIGAVLGVIGLLLLVMAVNPLLCFMLMLLGAVAVTVSVFAPVQ